MTPLNGSQTRSCRARSPSVRITQVRRWCGSRVLISALTSAMKVSLSAVRLAHTRLWLGRALGARSGSSPVSKAVEDLSRGADHRRLAVDRGDRRHPLRVWLLPLAAAHDAQRALTKGLARGNV